MTQIRMELNLSLSRWIHHLLSPRHGSHHVHVDLEVDVGEVLGLAEAQTGGNVHLKDRKVGGI